MSVHPSLEPSVAVGQAATDTTTTPTILTGNAATIAAVLDQVGKRGWAHFACHARVDFADPSRSGVVVADGTLTVRALAALDSTHTQLAFLSTCSTAPRGGELLDEAVNVASAFELAGYRHVIATMWPVGDLAARRFARLTYQRLAQGVDPAVAVHAAVREIRELLPDRPTVWAAPVHHGP
jgi:CHAT domain-containing protein